MKAKLRVQGRRVESRRVENRPPSLRAKLWVDWNGIALTEAGADLLEHIDAFGSLSEAARRLHFSYRRAWMLVDGINKHWPTPLVKLSVGGKNGGGARLTDLGHLAIRSFRDVQIHLDEFLREHSDVLAKSVGGGKKDSTRRHGGTEKTNSKF